ncbi:MAG: SpoIIE family protein phosphatase [Oscillospiraceae bacterium]
MSINHYGEQLCGDHVEIVENDDSSIIVLADGLGSGVKASILSTLTSKIISTMLAAGLDIRDAVETIAATLPICSERNTAFSTFTIIRLVDNIHADIIQYENPNVIMLRNGVHYEFPLTTMTIGEKTIYRSTVELADGDIFIAMSDGILYASEDGVLNNDWSRDKLIEFLEPLSRAELTAKLLTSIIVEETNKLYGGKPFDDATACVIKIRQRQTVNIAIGPPEDMSDNHRMMALFFAKEGKHVVCGGTTAKIAAEYLGVPVQTNLTSPDPDIPPISVIEGVDLTTEGIITVDKILSYATDYVKDNRSFEQWCYKKDGASLAARLLFEDATDINMFIGHAANPAHNEMPINFNVKMQILKKLSKRLKEMGKRVKVLDF